jgi:iron(III) transport system ATP-binding protein
MSAIAIRNVSKTYVGDDDAAAVSNLTLDIEPNQFVTLLGPSGCGKTTTLRLIAGFIAPDAGTIHVGERLLSSPGQVVPPEDRAMGMVFQNYAVWPHKTVYENVAFGLKLRRLAAPDMAMRVKSALELVNLSGFEQRLPNELSGGQQQRVALARSLVVEPQILLLDEPLSNLDAKLRERMRGELKQLQRRTGITFVYVTHDQAEALALSDRIAVIHEGRLQQYATPQDVYRKPASRVVADFMGIINLLPGKVIELRGERMSIRLETGWTCELAASKDVAQGSRIELAIRPEDVRLASTGGRTVNSAQIVERTFLGNATEYTVTLSDRTTARIQAHPREEFAIGETVEVILDTTYATVFDIAPGRRPESNT